MCADASKPRGNAQPAAVADFRSTGRSNVLPLCAPQTKRRSGPKVPAPGKQRLKSFHCNLKNSDNNDCDDFSAALTTVITMMQI